MSVPLGLPSSTDFIDAVSNGQRPITHHAKQYLGPSGGDIEWLLSTLSLFRSETAFTEYLLPHLVAGQSNAQAGLPHIQQALAQLRTDAGAEIVRVKKIIFDKLSSFAVEDSVALYTFLLRELKRAFGPFALSLITTNYDLTFETAFESDPARLQEFGVQDVDYSFRIQFGRSIYDAHSEYTWNPEQIEYLKIHGSLDWHRDTRDRCTRAGSITVPDDPDQMAILYPGFKGVPEVEPFSSLHVRLSRRLAEADKIIVIGFAFRDAFINSIFENSLRLRPTTPVYYYNPVEQFPQDSAAPRLIQNYPNFHHITRGIDKTENSLQLVDAGR
jgi:hypothetical protein